MKKNVLVILFIILISSCGIKNNNLIEQQEVIHNNQEIIKNQQGSGVSYDDIVSNFDENDKKFKEDNLGEYKWFLDGLKTCDDISNFNLLEKKGQEDFIKFLGLENFYNIVLTNNLTYDKYFDENGEILSEYKKYKIDEKDLLFVMFFTGKIEKNFFINQINSLSLKYYSIELSNSIILGIISQHIKTGEKITYDLCKKEFLDGYKNYKIEK